MILRLQTFLTGLLALLTAALLALAPASANPASGGYQLFGGAVSGYQADIQLASLGNFDYFAKVASECCNAPNTGAGGFYEPHAWRKNYDDFYNGNVTSTTVPPYSAKNVHLAGQRHPETGVLFDQRGYPIFDSHTAYDTRFTGSEFGGASYQTQMRMATRDLRTTIETNPQLRSQFNSTQLQAIQSADAKIPGYTWHHHQDSGRMQLVDQTVHRRTGHIGGEAMSGGQ